MAWTKQGNIKGPKGATGETGPQGEQGPQGKQGPQGVQGVQGETGADGKAATIAVGKVTTLDAGKSATVTNSGTTSAAVFDFAIPRGAKGEQGPQGETGPQGPAGENATTTNDATPTAHGLMSATDKAKLDGIAEGANKYSLPTGNGSTVGGVRLSDATNSTSDATQGIAATPAAVKLAYNRGSTGITDAAAAKEAADNAQATANSKQDKLTFATDDDIDGMDWS